MDINHDGYISREDFELMAKRLVEYTGEITEEKSEAIFTTFANVADLMGLKPGMKIPIEEAATVASDVLLSPTGEKPSGVHDMLFDCIDTNSNGTISIDEYRVYFKVIGHNISEEETKHCFDTIDSNGNSVISREEFVAAAEEFFYGVEETELSKVFYGQLLPQ